VGAHLTIPLSPMYGMARTRPVAGCGAVCDGPSSRGPRRALARRTRPEAHRVVDPARCPRSRAEAEPAPRNLAVHTIEATGAMAGRPQSRPVLSLRVLRKLQRAAGSRTGPHRPRVPFALRPQPDSAPIDEVFFMADISVFSVADVLVSPTAKSSKRPTVLAGIDPKLWHAYSTDRVHVDGRAIGSFAGCR